MCPRVTSEYSSITSINGTAVGVDEIYCVYQIVIEVAHLRMSIWSCKRGLQAQHGDK